ncbi:MAG TPA: HEAT repeat domain-containing protein [Longimicrobium sp.]|nr:HEAT repeat domain-containing protein [Longimicrobium sp.]
MPGWLDRLLSRAAPAPAPPPPEPREERPAERLARLLETAAFTDDGQAFDAAAEIRARLVSLPVAALAALDEPVRGALWYHAPGRDWLAATAAVRERFAPPLAVWVLGLLASHPNGYVREPAVQALAETGEPAALSFLLLRAADWVGPVRLRAEDGVRARLDEAHIGSFVATLPLVARLRESERAGASSLRGAIDELLTAAPAAPVLLDALGSSDAATRREAFRLLRAGGHVDARELAARGLRAGDVVVEAEAARLAIALDDDTFRGLLSEILSKGPARTRAEALVSAHRRWGAGAEEWLLWKLFDGSRNVRAVAQRALDGPQPGRAVAEYRRATQWTDLAVALTALGEMRVRKQADWVASFLSHPQARVRAAAAIATARLRGDASPPALLPLVGDAHPRVSGAATRALLPRARLVDTAVLERMYAADVHPHVRHNALRLLGRAGPWSGLRWLLVGAGDRDRRIAEMAMRELRAWRQRANRTVATPAADEMRGLHDALAAHGAALGDELRGWLAWLLGVAGR